MDKGITMAHLRGTLYHLAKVLFGPETKTRMRTNYFPVTEHHLLDARNLPTGEVEEVIVKRQRIAEVEWDDCFHGHALARRDILRGQWSIRGALVGVAQSLYTESTQENFS